MSGKIFLTLPDLGYGLGRQILINIHINKCKCVTMTGSTHGAYMVLHGALPKVMLGRMGWFSKHQVQESSELC